MRILKRFARILLNFLNIHENNISKWSKRVKMYGEKAVYNIGHKSSELENVTKFQKSIILPLIKSAVGESNEVKTALDFGCGSGRFTDDLAKIIDGRAIGVDPIVDLLNMAPKSKRCQYLKIKPFRKLPIESKSIDLLFICLVLGGIEERELFFLLKEFKRILKKNGLIILVENTSVLADEGIWKSRSVDQYEVLFKEFNIKKESEYYDLGEQISIFLTQKSN
jgi:ubiquinone/menaquinone biosynthesis C-methylase UbiE